MRKTRVLGCAYDAQGILSWGHLFQEAKFMPKDARNSRPLFVALEGLDGTGKSLQVQQLADAVRTWGKQVGVYRYTAIRDDCWVRAIRSIYKSEAQGKLKRSLARIRAIQEIMYAFQAWLNLRDLGDLGQYDVILCDRCAVTAFIAHVGAGSSRGLAEWLLSLLEFRFAPQHVIYLWIPLDLALRRVAHRAAVAWQDENVKSMERMEAAYNELAQRRWVPWILRNVTWHFVETADAPDIVQHKLQAVLKSVLTQEGIVLNEMQILANPRDGSV
jgi:thymidylate kinase